MAGITRLVDNGIRRYGRLVARPEDVNPLDAFKPIDRWLAKWRLKEWLGWTLIHPEIYSSMILQDAQYLASSEIYVRDKATGQLHEHARNARGGSLRLPQVLLGSSPSIVAKGYEIEYELDPAGQTHRIAVSVEATKRAPGFVGVLELDAAHASPPLSVSARLPGGALFTPELYTHKAVFPASGWLEVGSRRIEFEAARDFAILDEHKSILPYTTRWLWGTFATRHAGGILGANFVSRPELPGEAEESCLWVPGAARELNDVTFEHERDAMRPWRIASADKRLDVVFTPEGRKRARHQLGLVAIDYYQLYGRYVGTIGSAGVTYPVDVTGVCESMRMRS